MTAAIDPDISCHVGRDTTGALRLSVIVPVRDRSEHLRRCLEGLTNSARKPDQIVVVDDGSQDDSAKVALAFDCELLRLTGPAHGPAIARNHGAEISSGDILVFVDSDVIVHRDALGRIAHQFTRNEDVSALFGAYDDEPLDRSFVSAYRNLLHHHVHRHSRAEASTFWAGCGAIRRNVFMSVGGFDETQMFLEDVDLGLRLRARGHRILLCPEVEGTHQKRWGFWQMIQTDIAHRALPWTRLILRSGSLPNELNLSHRHRVSAICVWLLFVLSISSIRLPGVYLAGILPVALLVSCNLDLYRLFRRQLPLPFVPAAILLHWLHHLYASATFAVIVMAASARIFARVFISGKFPSKTPPEVGGVEITRV